MARHSDRRYRAQGARLRRLRRILEGAGKRISHAPPVDRELRPLAGRFALHARRFDVPVYDQRKRRTPGRGGCSCRFARPFGRLAGAAGGRFAGACCRRSRRSGRFAGASPFRPQAAGRRRRRFVGNRRFRTRFIGGRRRRGFAACRAVASRRAGPTRSRRFSGRRGACRFAGQCCGYADRRPAQGVAERGGEESQGRGKGGRRRDRG